MVRGRRRLGHVGHIEQSRHQRFGAATRIPRFGLEHNVCVKWRFVLHIRGQANETGQTALRRLSIKTFRIAARDSGKRGLDVHFDERLSECELGSMPRVSERRSDGYEDDVVGRKGFILDKVEEWVDRSEGHVRADVVHERLVAVGFAGDERTTRRAVAEAKTRWLAVSRSTSQMAARPSSFSIPFSATLLLEPTAT